LLYVIKSCDADRLNLHPAVVERFKCYLRLDWINTIKRVRKKEKKNPEMSLLLSHPDNGPSRSSNCSVLASTLFNHLCSVK
jgi:hypothetical protein